MQFLQLLLRRHRHATNSLIGILLVKESTIAYHNTGDTRIGTIVQRLQSATRHTSYADMFCINLLIIGRLGVIVLINNPVDALNLLVST